MLPSPDGSRVVLIGTSRFTDPSLADLPAVRDNLSGLASCFHDPGLWGLPAAHCVVVSDPVSADDLIDPVHDAAAAAEDTLLVYYSGHGLIDHDTNELLLALVNSRSGRSHTAVPYEYLRRDVTRARARRRVVILDCCYSGRALGAMSDATSMVADQASADGTYLLASAPPNQQALSPPGEPYTAFTGELVALLSAGLPDAGPELKLDAIYKHIYYVLRDRSRPLPQRRAGNTAGDLALARNLLWQPSGAPPRIDKHPQGKRARQDRSEVRELIKKLLRDNGSAGRYACPLCGVSVSGQNLVRHLDKHDPAELSTLNPKTLTLHKISDDVVDTVVHEPPQAVIHHALVERIRTMVRDLSLSGLYLCPHCGMAIGAEHLADHFAKHSPDETRTLTHLAKLERATTR